MHVGNQRREMIKKSLAFLAIPEVLTGKFLTMPDYHPNAANKLPAKLKLSCNLFSFNEPLTLGTMTLEDVIEYCATLGFEAVDPTGYYFTGYPEVPDDEYLYAIKKKAFLLGLDISGTGVRNDFTLENQEETEKNIELVKQWVEVAAKLGAPVIRVFAGKPLAEGRNRKKVTAQLVDCLKTCVEFGKASGVMITLQNHNEFLKTAEEVLDVKSQIDSDWLGLNVDIGSLRTGDPYTEIAKLAPHAYTWQIKEEVYRNDKAEKTDVKKIVRILNESGYRGYIPLETLGAGDPKEKLPRFLDEVKQALN